MTEKQILANVKKEMDKIYRQARNGLVKQGQAILVKSNSYAQEDTGKLISEGKVILIDDGTIAGLEVSINYGDGESAPYALTLHEYPSEYDPPSWNGVPVHFTKGGPKFLERAFNEHEKGMLSDLIKAFDTFEKSLK